MSRGPSGERVATQSAIGASARDPIAIRIPAWPGALTSAPARHRAWLRWMPGARRRVPAPLSEGGGLAALPPEPRILVVRGDHVGDVLLTGPSLQVLRAARPDAHLTMLVGPWGRAAAELLPAPDRVRTLPHPAFERGPRRAAAKAVPYVRLLRAAWRLRRDRYDLAVVPREDDWWAAWLCALAGIPIRWGTGHPEVAPFLTHAASWSDKGPPDHVAASALRLFVEADAGGAPRRGDEPAFHHHPLRVVTSDDDVRRAEALLGALPPGPPPVAIHPGSGSPIKRWPAHMWNALAHELTAVDEALVLTGGPAERELTADLAARVQRPVLDLGGRTTLGALAVVYRRCRLVLGPDSGPLHLAVAVGTPTVHLYGPADARRFGPWGPPDRHRAITSSLPCAPCARLDWPESLDHPCVRIIPFEAVLAGARTVQSG